MKKFVFILLLILMVNTSFAQHRNKKQVSVDNSGLIITGMGAVFSIIAITVPDGGDWTHQTQGIGNNQTNPIVYKPFFHQPARVTMLGIGITLSIGGLIHNHNQR